MSLATVRAEIAAAASTVAGLDVRPWPSVKIPMTGDGWVTVQRLVPGGFRTQSATFTVTACLGSDPGKAEELFDELGPALLDAVGNAVAIKDDSLERVILPPEKNGPYGMQLVLTSEV